YVVMFGHELPMKTAEVSFFFLIQIIPKKNSGLTPNDSNYCQSYLHMFHQLFQITKPIVEKYHGSSVEHCFAIFNSPADALNACLRIREMVSNNSEKLRKLQFFETTSPQSLTQ